MSYRRSRGSRFGVNQSTQSGSRAVSAQPSYVTQQSGTKRHQVQSVGSPAPIALLAGEYFKFQLLRFARSAAGGTDDVPPSATASNNYQSTVVFNGSKIRNYNSTIRIKNRGAIGGYLDVYECALSFFDVLVWDTIQTSTCPFTFDSTTVGPADLRGAVAFKTMTSTLIVKNTIHNFKFVQHYIKARGTIFVTNEDGGNGGEVTINVNRVPAKCRRSQTGMMWALFFHNDSDANGAETLALDATMDTSFEEIPSDNRLPFLE